MKKKKPKNLKLIARSLHDEIEADPGMPVTTEDIAFWYTLNDQQTKTVKDYIKKQFASEGASWLYDFEKNDGFKLAPAHDCTEQRRLFEGAAHHASNSTKALSWPIRAAEISGNISRADGKKAKRSIKLATDRIDQIPAKLEWLG